MRFRIINNLTTRCAREDDTGNVFLIVHAEKSDIAPVLVANYHVSAAPRPACFDCNSFVSGCYVTRAKGVRKSSGDPRLKLAKSVCRLGKGLMVRSLLL